MTIDILKACDIAPTVDLFCECFAEDHYYGIMFPDQSTRRDEMRKAFTQSISFCIRQGNSIGIKRDGTLVAFCCASIIGLPGRMMSSPFVCSLPTDSIGANCPMKVHCMAAFWSCLEGRSMECQ